MSEGSRELPITTGNAESGGVLVSVRDSGPGLAPATLPLHIVPRGLWPNPNVFSECYGFNVASAGTQSEEDPSTSQFLQESLRKPGAPPPPRPAMCAC